MYKYKAIKINGKKIDEHRHVMQQHLGRKLSNNEVVRHRDNNCKNNAIENLYVVTRQQQVKEQKAAGRLKIGKQEKSNKKPIYTSELISLRVDKKTLIYVKKGLSKSEIERIIKKHKDLMASRY